MIFTIKPFMIASSIALLSCSLAAGCNPMVEQELTITSGSYRYLTVDASKAEILSRLVAQRIDDVAPRYTEEQQTIVRKPGDLGELMLADEIVADDRGRGRFWARIAFENEEVVEIVISKRLFPRLAQSLTEGTPKRRAFGQLAELMDQWPKMVVYKVIPGMNRHDADPRNLSEDAKQWLLQYDVWHYSDVAADGYPEIFLLHFEDDRLVKIKYTKLNVY